jgi:rSAM/selenodomain-associated transferase 1
VLTGLNYRYPEGRLLIFARAPEPGRVKTRLAPHLGAEAAAGLHRELTVCALDLALQAELAPVELHVTPDTRHPSILSLLEERPVPTRAQRGADLGERMHGALEQALRGSAFALLIGTDCPVMTADYLDAACRQLQSGTDLVIGPAEDGGYVLIGVRCRCPALFEAIPWGTDGVLQATRARAQALRLRYAELGVLWDIDTLADLERWRAQRRFASGVADTKDNSLRERP